MATTRLPRTRTTAEAFGPVVKDLFAAIDQSKKLRGERLQVESVFKSLNSLDVNATPEERAAAITGGLQATRAQARSDNEGFLARIIEGLDPRVPSFGAGVTPIEKFVADQQLGVAFQDPTIRQSREASKAASEASAEASRARTAFFERGGATTTEKPLSSRTVKARANDMAARINGAQSSGRIGPNTQQPALVQAWKDHIAAPGTFWTTLTPKQQQDEWRDWNALIANKQANKKTGNEWEWDRASPEVQALTPGLPPEEDSEQRQDAGTSQAVTGPPAAFIPEGATDAEMADFSSGLIPEDQEKFAAMEAAWNEARSRGDIADQRHWEEAMSNIIAEAKRRRTPKTKALPQEFPIGLGIPTLKQRSSATRKPVKQRVILGGIHR